MSFHFNWKRTLFIMLDIVLAAYLGFAMTKFNRPDESSQICTKVSIKIEDDNANGFLSANEVKKLLQQKKIYPYEQKMEDVNPRYIEDFLKQSSFVNTAECYKTENGHVNITITQQLPILRIKSENGDDYYLDNNGGILPNSKYTSDLIIATGNVSTTFAKTSLSCLAKTINKSEFWHNQIEQINVLPDYGIELVPRVGDHIIFLGYLPQNKDNVKRQQMVSDYVIRKLNRLEKFYLYGLSETGWNRYHYISLQYDNQIICRRNFNTPTPQLLTAPPPVPTETQQNDGPSEGETNEPAAVEQKKSEKTQDEKPEKNTPAKTEDNKQSKQKLAKQKENNKKSV